MAAQLPLAGAVGRPVGLWQGGGGSQRVVAPTGRRRPVRCAPLTSATVGGARRLTRWVGERGAAAALVAVAAGLRSGGLRRTDREPKKKREDPFSDLPAGASPAERRQRFKEMMLKKHGEGSVVPMSQKTMEVEFFSTGALTVDLALGGGLPCGRIVEVYGPEMSGKTTLSLHCIASINKAGGLCAFVDAECAIDMQYATTIGVDEDMCDFIEAASAEQATERIIDAAQSGAYKLIVLDSVAALSPEEEQGKRMDEANVAALARVMSKFMRKVTPVLAETGTTLILINQLRANLGGFGPSDITTGGKAIKFHASVRMWVRSPKSGMVGPAGTPTGIRSKVTVTKNKLAAPHRSAEYDVIYGEGICWASSVFEAAVSRKVAVKKGSSIQFDGHKEKGREKFLQMLRENPPLLKKLEQATRKAPAARANAEEGEEEKEEEEEEWEEEEEEEEEEEQEEEQEQEQEEKKEEKKEAHKPRRAMAKAKAKAKAEDEEEKQEQEEKEARKPRRAKAKAKAEGDEDNEEGQKKEEKASKPRRTKAKAKVGEEEEGKEKKE